MKLNQLLRGVALTGCRADQDVEITGVSYDTRTMAPGGLFAALEGYKTDGQLYIREALEKGAVAVLCRRAPDFDGPWLMAEDPRAALALISANWFGHPAEALTCVAVTGTNGKTTTTYLLKAALEGALHAKVGLIGTNQNMIGEEVLPAHRTTPESYELQELLRAMADAGCTHVVMEASSIALVLHRTGGIRFAAGIFTNLTPDHLDFHGTMEAYRTAKGLLFDQTDLAVVNLDDDAGRYYAESAPCPVFTYSERKDEADLVAKNIRLFPSHVEFEAVARNTIGRIFLPIPGGFSIYNALRGGVCPEPGRRTSGHRRRPALGKGGERAGRGGPRSGGLYGHHRLCPYAGCPGEHPYHGAGSDGPAGHLPVWLRRRPGQEQASCDGLHCRGPCRYMCRHLG